MGKIAGRVQLKYAEAVKKSLMTTAKKAGVRAPYNQHEPFERKHSRAHAIII